MDAERLERAARAAFEEWMCREEPSYDCSEEALFSTFFDGFCAALDAAPEPAQVGEAVAWGVRKYDGAMVIAFVGDRAEWVARHYPLPALGTPYEAVPLYAHPAPPAPDAATGGAA